MESCLQKYKDLEKVIEEFDSISQELVNMDSSRIERNYLSPSSGSLKSSSNNKSAIVRSENDFNQILDRLNGEPTKLEIIPIVGMKSKERLHFQEIFMNIYKLCVALMFVPGLLVLSILRESTKY